MKRSFDDTDDSVCFACYLVNMMTEFKVNEYGTTKLTLEESSH